MSRKSSSTGLLGNEHLGRLCKSLIQVMVTMMASSDIGW